MTLLPGIQIDTKLYESSQSVIYRGLRVTDTLPVVLKRLVLDQTDPEAIGRFKREYEIMRGLKIDSVVRVYGLHVLDSDLIMIQEDFAAKSLDLFQSEFELIGFLEIALLISEALESLHTTGIIHCDLNPSNILLNENTRQLKLTDFGSAIILENASEPSTIDGQLSGTPLYMSPEQTGRLNRPVDYRSDLYSLGVTLYELLTGQPPFTKSDLSTLTYNHLARRPISPHQLKNCIPRAVSDIVMKLMAKNPNDRYQNISRLKVDLQECWTRLKSHEAIQDFTPGQKEITTLLQIPPTLYGRENERSELISAFHRASQERPEFVLVGGYSGIGKTSLIRDTFKSIPSGQCYFLSGKFDQYNLDNPYTVLAQIFNDLIHRILTENEIEIATWRDRFQQAVGRNGQVVVNVIPELELIVGPQPAVVDLPSQETQNRLDQVFYNLTTAFTNVALPVVVFLDDLQWVTPITLRLFSQSLLYQKTGKLLVVGAYRNNEINKTHPLTVMINEVKDAGIPYRHLHLTALKEEDSEQLLSDTLFRPLADVQEAAELVQQKTGGNPHFIKQFLAAAYQARAFYLNDGIWEWDLIIIDEMLSTDNVAELISHNMLRLSSGTRESLKTAACFVSGFNAERLAAVNQKSVSMVFAELQEARDEGFIILFNEKDMDRSGPLCRFRFSHDRVQQTFYTLLSDEKKKQCHREIGCLLLERNQPNIPNEKILEIVKQLNMALDIITSATEKYETAALNLRAGKIAKTQTAYHVSLECLMAGIHVLPACARKNNLRLWLDLHLEATEAAYLEGMPEKAEEWAKIIEQGDYSLHDRIRLEEIRMQSLIATHKMSEAVRLSLKALKHLGIHIPSHPRKIDVLLALARTKVALWGKHPSVLAELPVMTDSSMMAAMRILMHAASAAYIAQPKVVPFIVFQMVRLSLRFGTSPLTPYAYISYAFILCGPLGDINNGFRYGEFALELMDRLQAGVVSAKVILMFNVFIRHWKKHLNETLVPLMEGYQKGLENGDLEYGAICLYMYCDHLYLLGDNLETVDKEIASHMDTISKFKQERLSYMMRELQQLIRNLSGKSLDPVCLSGPDFDEDTAVSSFLKADDGTSLSGFYLHKAVLYYLFYDYRKALDCIEKGTKYLDSLNGFSYIPRYIFYHALILAALVPEVSHPNKKRYGKKIRPLLRKLKKWAEASPLNHLHKYYLLEAEMARISGKPYQAASYYDEAVQAAGKSGYRDEEALANEAAGRFRLGEGNLKLARIYLREAYIGYELWGAHGKVQAMTKKYPHLIVSGSTESHPQDGFSVQDLTSLLKASQALSEEIVLERLLKKMMENVIENAGAEHGYLILNENGKLTLAAHGSVEKGSFKILPSLPLDPKDNAVSPSVPRSIIQYTARSGKEVILVDATIDQRFENDAYIRRFCPKSILCMPLNYRGGLSGILYLENNLTTGAFVEERIRVLRSLTAHMAVSVENAEMYQTVREMSGRILTAQEEERKRLARELHDGPGQSLPAVKLNLQMMAAKVKAGTPIHSEDFTELTEELSRSIDELRDMAMDLRPSFLEDTELDVILRWYGGKYQQRTGISLVVDAEKIETSHARLKDNIYRIFQEALSNAHKHSEADEISVFLGKRGKHILLRIQDNGLGFDSTVTAKKRTGLGLSTMKERTELLNGDFRITSSLNHGTTIEIEVPFQ